MPQIHSNRRAGFGTISVNGGVFTSTGAGAELFVGDIIGALTGGANVKVVTGATGSATGGILTLHSGVDLDFNGTGTNTLTLQAHRRITLDGRILDSTPGGDTLNLVLIADSDSNGSGNIQLNNTVSLGGRRLTNIAPGIASNDAATVGQVNQSAKRAYGGVATAMAMGGIAVPDSKLYAVSANLGAYRGEAALAGGVALRLTDNATVNGSLGVGVTRGDLGGRVGVTFAW